MATPQEIRNIRLSNDFQAMNNIKGHIIDWQPIKGTAPYIEAYRLTVKVRSIKGEGPQYREQHEITVELPEGYPNARPMTKMITNPVVFHPNWYADGRWCEGTWDVSEGLGDYVIRMIRTLQFDPVITHEGSAANSNAKNWYVSNRNRGIFPCDNQVLPDPSKKKTFIIQGQKKTFTIHSNS